MALFELQPSVALQEFIRVYRIVHFVFDSKATLLLRRIRQEQNTV